MAATAEEINHVRSVQTFSATALGILGQVYLINKEWAGAGNFNPVSGSKGSAVFDQPTLDSIFGPNVLSTTDWANIEAAVGACWNAIDANSQLFARLRSASIIGG